MEGFFVPGSQSSSYVSNKRNEEGSYAYDSAAIDIGQQKQAALQDLSKTYESTIENAYASYLANQRNIATSAMGQGYQEAYNQLAQQNLINNITSTTQSLNQARLELEEQESAARKDLNTMFATETANLDKVVTSMDNYLTYIKGLSNTSGQGYLSDEQQNQTVDELYDVLFGAQPQGFTDEEGNSGLTYSQWVHSQLNDSDMDQDWYNWLFYQGGWQDFQNALAKERNQTAANQYQADLVAAEEARKAEAEKQAQEEAAAQDRQNKLNDANYQGKIGTIQSSNVDLGKTGKASNKTVVLDNTEYRGVEYIYVRTKGTDSFNKYVDELTKIYDNGIEKGEIVKVKGQLFVYTKDKIFMQLEQVYQPYPGEVRPLF